MKALRRLNPNAVSMKKLFAVLVCACAVMAFNPTFAQDEESADGAGKEGSGLVVGIRTGVNYSKFIISGSGDSESERKVGAVAGAFATYHFNQWAGASLEVLFAQTAAGRVAYQSSTSQGTSDFTLSNVEVNLLGDFKIPVISVYKPRFYAGPSFAFNSHAISNNEGFMNGSNIPVKFRNDVTNQFKAVEYAAIVGAGLDFDLKVGTLRVDARYRRGINNISGKNFNFSEGSQFRNRTIHTNTLSFQAAFGINL